MRRTALPCCWLALLLLLLGGCAATQYPTRDDHDHTPGPPLLPAPPMSSMPEGG